MSDHQDECDYTKTGHCLAHNVEIERRKNMAKELSDFGDDIRSIGISLKYIIEEKIPEIRGVQRWVNGVIVVLLLIFGMSYVFAYMGDNQIRSLIKKEDVHLNERVAQNKEEIADVETQLRTAVVLLNQMSQHQARVEGRLDSEFNTILRALETNNQYIQALISHDKEVKANEGYGN